MYKETCSQEVTNQNSKLETQTKAAAMDKLTSSVASMAVSNDSPYGFDAKLPINIWKFTGISSYKIMVQLITPPLTKHFSRLK